MPNLNVYPYANYNQNFTMYSVLVKSTELNRLILGNSRPDNSHGFTMSITISVQVSQSHGQSISLCTSTDAGLMVQVTSTS